ncbi:hypothetical protein QJS04_geneDACA022204 [Acorus gramineus]|uniref:Nucleoporin Nup133/Nup155-like N-terminal domain-containing protein n=1 Tax=Acorus gramineus TaxID=55184 RepID=A0AAV9BCG2_ACOGR|nr:hypothetical protein QJS04_geneDACA022204 [Acorus gramineus]
MGGNRGAGSCSSAGIVACNKKTHTVIYWPDIYSDSGSTPVISYPSSDESADDEIDHDGGAMVNRSQEIGRIGYFGEGSSLNSLIASAIPGESLQCIALACRSNGELWHFLCTPSGTYRENVSQDISASSSAQENGNTGYARSLAWHFQRCISEISSREFFLLTNSEIQCWSVGLTPNKNVVKLWSHRIVGTDVDLGIKKDLAGQKHIWLLDMQVDERGKEFTILVATLCKDRTSSSNYTQYSLLTMQYKPEKNVSLESRGLTSEPILEKKTPPQVIIPKGRVEENEDFLFSMRLRVGGKPSGSAVILSGDGTATVTNYRRGSTRLYQFDLPWDAGKVLDASVLPSMEDSEEGAWVVLTEKAGVWAIPEKAVLIGGVEPPERSVSRKGSSNEGAAEEEKRSILFRGNIAPRRASSVAWGAGDRQQAAVTSIAHRTSQDEEAEALIGRVFHNFILTGQVDESLKKKLMNSGAFERDGETNVFTRWSKSIVDSLAKHWTTTRGAEIVSLAIVSSQLSDKQQKHQQFLQFLALSKCHEELYSKQRHSLQIIMEHGEKLAGMIQLRELHAVSQNQSKEGAYASSHSHKEMAGSLWDLIQLVGEKARRNSVLLMDRDNAEVFYSKVSDIEELFRCLSHHSSYIIDGNQPLIIQIRRACEASNAGTTVVRTAMLYKNEHNIWYPSPEGLTPWYCEPVVRSGLWSMASVILKLLKEAAGMDMSVRLDLHSNLEGLADVLLEAYLVSITAKTEREEEHQGLKDEYCQRKDAVLASIYQNVKVFADAKYQDSLKGAEDVELKQAILRELASSVLSLAKRHASYQTLWSICYDLNDNELLRGLMHESSGPKGGFSYFVFQKLYENSQHAKLLRLGEEFQEELAIFLKEHKELLWLHELFVNQSSSASETLHALALSHGNASLNNESETNYAQREPSLAARRRFLYLSKIAAFAGKESGFETKARRIDADLHILKLQEEILRLTSDSRDSQPINHPLPPRELIELCLKSGNRDLSLLAFDMFAWTSTYFRRSNKSLLEQCWLNAADQDDWLGLCQASKIQGWSDEAVQLHLRETVLFKASSRCYGPDSETYDGGFEEVLPIQKSEVEFLSLKDESWSVEGVLTKHKDYPDAGKLMVMAVVLGKMEADVAAEEDMLME